MNKLSRLIENVLANEAKEVTFATILLLEGANIVWLDIDFHV
jgi:hypothetical protein